MWDTLPDNFGNGFIGPDQELANDMPLHYFPLKRGPPAERPGMGICGVIPCDCAACWTAGGCVAAPIAPGAMPPVIMGCICGDPGAIIRPTPICLNAAIGDCWLTAI
jgi:hypothetical protein